MSWRLLAYEALTQSILVLAWLRAKTVGEDSDSGRFHYPPGRVFHVFKVDHFQCCDCKLSHVVRYEGQVGDCGHEHEPGCEVVGHCWPRRPVGYAYKLRRLAATPALAKALTVVTLIVLTACHRTDEINPSALAPPPEVLAPLTAVEAVETVLEAVDPPPATVESARAALAGSYACHTDACTEARAALWSALYECRDSGQLACGATGRDESEIKATAAGLEAAMREAGQR